MCFEKLLSMKDCNMPAPITDLYIDELGISNTFLGNLITDQYVSGKDLFIEKRKSAWRKVTSDVLKNLASNMKSDTLIENKRVGQKNSVQGVTQTPLGVGNFVGIKLRLTPNTKSFVKIFIADVLIDTDAGLPFDFYVYNLTTGELLQTYTYTSLGADQYIAFEFSGKRREVELAIFYESVFTPKKYTINGASSCSSCGGGVKEPYSCPYVRTSGVKLTLDGSGKVDTYQTQNNTWGMSLSYNISCDRSEWLCSIGGLIALPLAYATAIEIYDYALTFSGNQRVNSVVGINRGIESDPSNGIYRAREIAVTRYGDEMQSLLQNMRLPDDPKCWDCRKNIVYVTALP